jgi:signal transduction histidine kinase
LRVNIRVAMAERSPRRAVRGGRRLTLLAGAIGALSLAAILAVAYRIATVQGIVANAHEQNLALAQGAFDSNDHAFAGYLVATATEPGGDGTQGAMPKLLEDAIRGVMRYPGVTGIKIYSRMGVVRASTTPSEVGANEADNPGFRAAMKGEALANLVSRRAPTATEGTADDDTFVESFIPVRKLPGDAILGVVEISSDIGAFVKRANRSSFEIFAAAAFTLATIGSVWLIVLRQTTPMPESLGTVTRDRSALVEVLSNRRLRREELERKILAADLQEDVAQSLCAIKMAAETATSGTSLGDRGTDALKFVVSELQCAIQRVRAIATDLRPSSLDDFGLLATVRDMCLVFGDRHPEIRVDLQITGKEVLIPAPLKIVVYRNVESALRVIGERGVARRVRITLRAESDALMLGVTDDTTGVLPAAAYINMDVDTESPLSPIRERTVISGGQLAIARGDPGALELRARWNHPPERRRSPRI